MSFDKGLSDINIYISITGFKEINERILQVTVCILALNFYIYTKSLNKNISFIGHLTQHFALIAGIFLASGGNHETSQWFDDRASHEDAW